MNAISLLTIGKSSFNGVFGSLGSRSLTHATDMSLLTLCFSLLENPKPVAIVLTLFSGSLLLIYNLQALVSTAIK